MGTGVGFKVVGSLVGAVVGLRLGFPGVTVGTGVVGCLVGKAVGSEVVGCLDGAGLGMGVVGTLFVRLVVGRGVGLFVVGIIGLDITGSSCAGVSTGCTEEGSSVGLLVGEKVEVPGLVTGGDIVGPSGVDIDVDVDGLVVEVPPGNVGLGPVVDS